MHTAIRSAWSKCRDWIRSRREVGQPRLICIGPTAIWWIPKPRSPRMVLSTHLLAWLVALPVVGCTLYWCHLLGRPLWPFTHSVSTSPEILLRYELVLLVCLLYVTIRSLPAWWANWLQAKRDMPDIEAAIQEQKWDLAALLVHRYCLLRSAFRKRRPPQVGQWDDLLRPRLSRHRRLYLYFRGRAPELPPDPTASFVPVVAPPPQASLLLSGTVLILVGGLLYSLILDLARHRYWQGLILFNSILLVFILLTYGGHFLLGLLGQSVYYRFAPGIIQLVRFRLGRRRPEIQSLNLREGHAVVDLSSRWPGITLLKFDGRPEATWPLPKRQEVNTALFRAVLSTAVSPPLSDDGLIG